MMAGVTDNEKAMIQILAKHKTHRPIMQTVEQHLHLSETPTLILTSIVTEC